MPANSWSAWKADVDHVEASSPAIAIEQVNPVKHSRSTVVDHHGNL
jgi:excinuclease UvrABC ATPase subunit